MLRLLPTWEPRQWADANEQQLLLPLKDRDERRQGGMERRRKEEEEEEKKRVQMQVQAAWENQRRRGAQKRTLDLPGKGNEHEGGFKK